jgi:hypothetical protein
MVPTQEMFRGLKDTFGRMTDVQTAVQALQEAELFCTQVGEFGTDMARQIVTPDFPKETKCLPICMPGSSFMHIVTYK